MLVFILDFNHQDTALGLTEQRVRQTFADARIIAVRADYAAVMNTAITDDPGPFFITLYAGESISGSFAEELQSWIRNLPEDAAGIVLTPLPESMHDRSIPRGPVIWRTNAVLTGTHPGFLPSRLLPFERYILLEMQYRRTPDWQWNEERTTSWRPRPYQGARWENPREEWASLEPVLAARMSCSPFGGHPLFTIVICTFNNGRYLEWAVRSVLVQSFTEWELLIIDDGSQDATAALLAPYSGHPRISILRNEANRGKSYCLNRTLAQAKGSWFIELDADDWLSPDCLSVFADQIRHNPKAGAYYADYYEWFERTGKQLVFRKTIRKTLSPFVPEALLETAVPLAPRCYRADALKALGGWWETDPFGGRLYEDFQMLIRMFGKHPVLHVEQALYHRRLRADSTTSSNSISYESWKKWFRNRIRENTI